MKPDRAVLIYKKSQLLEATKGDFTRIYYGSDTCDFLIPSKSEIDALQKIYEKLKIDFTIVTPYMTQHNFYLAERMLKYLAEVSPCAEVVVNDWGIINFINEHYPKFTMIFGRILNRQRRSFFYSDREIADTQLIEDLKELKKDDRKYLKASILQNGYATQLLESMHIDRIGLDNTKQGLLLGNSQNIKIDLYYPYCYLTSSSNCYTRTLAMKPLRFERTDQCTKPCLRTKVRKIKVCGEDVYLMGNYQAYFNDKLNPKVMQKVDRLIEVKI